ncbi:MAG: hypothetical protein NPIRA02_00870 [Nitrospirales bacterium]|nr:MAG: hypothetical protein NPIRA02_00870 [Nitrospirales bacterium]
MNSDARETQEKVLGEITAQLHEATQAEKCWPCGCLHQSLQTIEQAVPSDQRSPELISALTAAAASLLPVKYECLGCQVCYPALAVNALSQMSGDKSLDVCPTDAVEVRAGWPPLPGNYTVLRYHAPVAVCTLTDDALSSTLSSQAGPAMAIIGTLHTENLGIERLIQNVLANPYIRFLVVCGDDSRQAIGHLPGQSLVALARHGLDDRSRIQEARGKRPVIRNVDRAAVEHFRQTIEVIDLIGTNDLGTIHAMGQECADLNPGPSDPFVFAEVVSPIPGYIPSRMIPDPAGYFVVYVDHHGGCLFLEHYKNTGFLDGVIQGHSAPELYTPAIERGWLSRLDHAAYLGSELTRAERALFTGTPFVQDAAPERANDSIPT